MYYTNVSRSCACPCELYVGDMWCGETQHTPELRTAHLGFSQVSLAQFLLNMCLIFSRQSVAVSHEKTSRETMSEGEILNAEIVFIKDAVAGGAGSTIPAETELKVSTIRALSMILQQKVIDII